MPAKLIFMSAEDRTLVENVRPYRKSIQHLDGHHFCGPNAVWRDRQKILPPIIVLWHGVPVPEGETWDLEKAENVWKEQETHKIFRQPVKVSKRWVRLVVRYLVIFGKVFLVSMGAGMLVLFLGVLL